jgi:hydroxymethylpyrimidine/phosphomethylpyrimidine kinase
VNAQTAEVQLPVTLTIAGSDSGAGAGIQADLLTFAANGVFGTTAITCLTAQNPDGVSSIAPMDAEFVTAQLLQVSAFFPLAAVKTGMLFNDSIVRAVARFLKRIPATPAVIDPVMIATSGAILLQEPAVEAIRTELLPLAALVTPNLDEAAFLLGSKPATRDAMIPAARELASRFGVPFLVKGGHLDSSTVLDALAWPDGRAMEFTGPRIENVDTHGSGCTLAAAIAAQLAKGAPLETAVKLGRDYLRQGLEQAIPVGGRHFIRHIF